MSLHLPLRILAIVFACLFAGLAAAEAETRSSTWRAGAAIDDAELIAVVQGPELGRFFSAADIFVHGAPARIQRYNVTGVLLGDVEEESKIVIVQPRSHMKGYANLLRGSSLLFLRQLDEDSVERLQEDTPGWADKLPDELWTFVEEREQWMSWIQLAAIQPDGEVDERPRSTLVTQLARYADVEPEREAILTYIKELVALRRAVLEKELAPDEEGLDRFQRDVVRAAVSERVDDTD